MRGMPRPVRVEYENPDGIGTSWERAAVPVRSCAPGYRDDDDRRRFLEIGACFGERLRNPFDDLRGGLVLGGEVFWEKVCALVDRSDARDAIRWRRRVGQQQLQARIDNLVREQDDPRVRIWVRVRLGGQRMSQVASACRYSDGSSVYRVIQRLEARAKKDRKLATYLRKLERTVKSSSVMR